MSTILTSEIACKTINTYSARAKEESKLKRKEYVSEKVLTVAGILFITILLRFLIKI